MQKIIFILFTSLLLFGCDSIEEGLIDPNDGDFSVTDIQAPTYLEYAGTETKLNTTITFSDSRAIIVAWVKVSAQDGSFDITYRREMSNSSENQYSTSIEMTSEMPSTKYTIDYHYQTETQSDKKIASHDFTYDNMQNNSAPVIANPLFYYVANEASLMDTIQNGTVNEFVLSIEVADSNGINDIDSVFVDLFNYQDPNNTIETSKIPLYDDGSDDHGDKLADDGIYSRKGYFPDDSEGNRKFDFIAIDRRGVKSNIVSHNFVVVK